MQTNVPLKNYDCSIQRFRFFISRQKILKPSASRLLQTCISFLSVFFIEVTRQTTKTKSVQSFQQRGLNLFRVKPDYKGTGMKASLGFIVHSIGWYKGFSTVDWMISPLKSSFNTKEKKIIMSAGSESEKKYSGVKPKARESWRPRFSRSTDAQTFTAHEPGVMWLLAAEVLRLYDCSTRRVRVVLRCQ